MMSIYSLLNQHAKAWWYHRQLRDHGKLVEARDLERRSIRGDIEKFRSALATAGAYLSIGRGGVTFWYSENARCEHMQVEPAREICRRLGIPIIDSTTATIDKVYDVAVRGPMIAVGRDPDPEPWNCYAYAPLKTVAESYRLAGAVVENV